MGFVSTIVVLNDQLADIAKDKDFGKKVEQAILSLSMGKPVDITGSSAIETHHADGIHLIAVGGNMGEDLGWVGSYAATKEQMLRNWASNLGYNIHKKPKRGKS